MKILILEPYMTGSHAAWAEEYSARSAFQVEILGLPGRHWKWRMHGGAVTLAERFITGDYHPDLILASDMLDLTTFLALTRARTENIKAAVYFHENQISYPWSNDDPDPGSQRDRHYGFINYTSALAADRVLFNSHYHRDIFFRELPLFLRAFPDFNSLEEVGKIRAKSAVLPLGLDLKRFDDHPGPNQSHESERSYSTGCSDRLPSSHGPDLSGRLRRSQSPALILWNHRWEYDKNPQDFFRALFILDKEGLDFELAVLGESFEQEPPVFVRARTGLAKRIVRFGYEEDFNRYASWLKRADILPVTSIHDFFGSSVVQALYCNTYPLLPRRLAYPEHIPEKERERFFYHDFDDLMNKLKARIEDISGTRDTLTRSFVERYDWSVMAPRYDQMFGQFLYLL
ncbi:MAG: DUF3524 domain-containing protein [Candidatus Krumholzibacteriota bacterium]|nr:DUF3524 domain-containing protein [Candidatus Krumholzibacteriota bacterium]